MPFQYIASTIDVSYVRVKAFVSKTHMEETIHYLKHLWPLHGKAQRLTE